MSRNTSAFRLIVQPLAIAVVLALAFRTAVRIYSIPSASMAPTLLVGDHILVTPYGSWLGEGQPRRGDVIVFRSPIDPGEVMVKRVVALPGDLIASSLGRVTIGGHTLAERYVTNAMASGVIAPQLVSGDRLFVMGDNRADSYDSRSWGALPRDLVLGRARVVLWSSPLPSGDPFRAPRASASPLQTRLGRIAVRPRVERMFLRIE